MKILILEESPLARRFIKDELLPADYQLLEAGTPEEALEVLGRVEGIDLLALRVVMKGMDGFEFLEHLQKPEQQAMLKGTGNQRVPAVFVTSNDTDKDRLRGFQVGAADFIQKPWAPGDLLNQVNRVLGRSTELAGMSILVVDDSRTARNFIRNSLTRLGVTIHEADDGDVAAEFLRDNADQVDLVITDLNMKRMDGDRLTLLIRGELGLTDLPVIFLSGNEDNEKVLTLFKMGATDYLKKPFLQEELVARIRAYLQRVRAQSRLQESVGQLRDMNVVKDQFLAVCSHDLRSPLTGILGFAQLLESESDLGEGSLEMVQGIRRSGEYLLDLINNLLDIGKMASGHHEVKMCPQNLDSIIADSVRTLEHTASPKKIELTTNVGCEDCRVLGDSSSLLRICNNLLSNAIKFTPEGGRVTVSLRDGRDGELVLAVTDTGLGIAEDMIPSLFDRYTKNSTSGTSGEKGTGLGLAITRELVEAHGGSVAVESQLGEGTTFRIHFPLLAVDGCPAAVNDAAEGELDISLVMPGQEPAAEAPEEVPIEGCHILYADDNATNRKVGARLLEKMGHEVVLAADGSEALALYKKGCRGRAFDVILMDLMMPGMDGLEATRLIRQHEGRLPDDHPAGLRPVPILAVTAGSADLDMSNCLSVGMNDFLTKPFVTGQLSESIDRWSLVTAF